MYHVPVLLQEAIELLVTDPHGCYVDGTLGGGSHAQAILEKLTENGKVVGIDQDMDAIHYSREKLRPYGNRFTAIHQNFAQLTSVLVQNGIAKINGLLLDLGISSHQIDTPERGFSFDRQGELDMRMNTKDRRTAKDIINTGTEAELADLIYHYGEERRARRIARSLVKARLDGPINSTDRLKAIVSKTSPYQQRAKTLARVFQAFRIAVNEELQRLHEVLRASLTVLQPGGRIVVISYHSLEDRICKTFFREEASRCNCPPELPMCVCNKKNRLSVLTRRPVKPTVSEIQKNPRSRSAKLRAAEYLG
jgi:16S rRNA (cytosine1402-N4)-methyltransferase